MSNVNALMQTGSRKSWEGDHGLQRKPREITSDQDHKEDLEEPAQSIGSEFSCSKITFKPKKEAKMV